MKDRLGNELKIGDLCVCYNNMGTGSSTYRLVQYEGKIIGFTPKLVKLKCVKCSYKERIGEEFKCYSDNIFKIIPVVRGEWIDFRGKPQCFLCKSVFPEHYYDFNHCPNCGAKMDLEEEQ